MISMVFGIVQAAYNIGGHIISANTIEQSVFCFHTLRVGRVIKQTSAVDIISNELKTKEDCISYTISLNCSGSSQSFLLP